MKIQIFTEIASKYLTCQVKIAGFICLFLPKIIFGQIPHYWLKDTTLVNPHKWSLEWDSKSFLHNREYFGTIENGYTLFGQQAQLLAVYQPNQKLKIQAGIFGSKDFGNNKFTSIKPYYALNYGSDSAQFVFGNLKANLNHGLIEPLYAFENNITQTLENGIQYKKITSKNNLDVWIDWQKMIYQKSTFQEEIWGGFHNDFTIAQNSKISISIPTQLSIKHRGGQINVGTERVVNQMAFAIGLKANMNKTKQLHYYYVASSNDSSPLINNNLSNGSGHYLQINSQFKNIFVAVNYFSSTNFYHFNGSDVFQNGSVYDTKLYQKNKKIALLRFHYNKELVPKLWLSFRFEPYLDIISGNFNHSQGLFLRYQEIFELKK